MPVRQIIQPENKKLKKLFKEFGFNTLLADMVATAKTEVNTISTYTTP